MAVVAALLLSACGGRLVKKQYEYEEELYLGLDGAATLNVNASVPALVAPKSARAQGRGGPPPTPKASAPIDLTGYWVSVVNEDWRYRMVTPAKGDYKGVPITQEALRIVNAWNPAADEAAGQQASKHVRIALSGIARARQRAGMVAVAEMLRGIDSERTRRFGFTELSTFGLLSDHSQAWTVALLRALGSRVFGGTTCGTAPLHTWPNRARALSRSRRCSGIERWAW